MMLFRSALVASAAFLISGPATAGEPDVSKDALSLSARLDTAGRLRLSGRNAETGERFELKVTPNGFVSGRVGARTVRYWVAPAEYARVVQKESRHMLKAAAGSRPGVLSR